MKKLLLIRHAKSDWNQPAGDFERPLLAHGVSSAHKVGEAVSKYLKEPFIIWSSPAKRAKHTALIISEELAYPKEDIIFKEALYTFDGQTVENIIKTCDDDHHCLVVFGHNEGITDFVNKFGDIFIDNVPTAGAVCLIFDTDRWSTIQKGTTAKVFFPRDL